MINEKQAKKYCREDISAIENYDKAINDTTQMWVCHHRDEVKILPSGIEVRRSKEELIENDRYYGCPANELIFLTKTEHLILHNKGNKHSLGKKNSLGKTWSEFGRKFKEHYGKTYLDDVNLYSKEQMWYKNHNNKCRWE